MGTNPNLAKSISSIFKFVCKISEQKIDTRARIDSICDVTELDGELHIVADVKYMYHPLWEQSTEHITIPNEELERLWEEFEASSRNT